MKVHESHQYDVCALLHSHPLIQSQNLSRVPFHTENRQVSFDRVLVHS